MKSIGQSLSERIGRQARRRPASAKKRRNACLQVEPLEDRTVPTKINLFPIPTPSSLPTAITAGPDGNLWFTESQANQIGSINPTTHAIQEFKIPQGLNGPAGITLGPDGNLWFTLMGNSQLCQFNPTTHVFHQFPIGAPALNLTTAPNDVFEDGYPVLWLTEPSGHQLEVFDTTVNKVTETLPFGPSDQPWAITSDGHSVWATDLSGGIYQWSFLTSPASQSAYPIPTPNSEPTGITVDGSGNAWFTELGANQIGMINPNNGNLTEFTIPTVNGQNAEPYAITLGPDGNLWFTEFMSIQNANGSFANYIGEINPTTHTITQIQLPVAPGAAGAGAGPAGITPGPDGKIWFVEKGIIASEEHPQTGNAVGEVVLGNGKGMKAVGGSSGGGGSSSGTQFGNDINQALQDIVLAVNALRAGNPSLALQDLSGFEFALTAALRDIVQTLSADLTAVAVSLEGGGGRTPLQGFQAAENLLLSDLAQPALQVQRAESSFGALMT